MAYSRSLLLNQGSDIVEILDEYIDKTGVEVQVFYSFVDHVLDTALKRGRS